MMEHILSPRLDIEPCDASKLPNESWIDSTLADFSLLREYLSLRHEQNQNTARHMPAFA